MGRSGETFNKKEVRNKKEKKRKEKEKRKLAKKEEGKNSFDDMIAYVDENGMITTTPPDLSKKEEINAEDIVIGVPTKEEEPEELIRTGTVDFFDSSKGFGFIKDAKTKESIFVHINNVQADSLKEGNLVTFETEMGNKGPVAINVKLSK
jgi:cold shock CspA family protein